MKAAFLLCLKECLQLVEGSHPARLGTPHLAYMDEIDKLHKIYFSTLFYNIPF